MCFMFPLKLNICCRCVKVLKVNSNFKISGDREALLNSLNFSMAGSTSNNVKCVKSCTEGCVF